jgi:hypothetical protein
MRSRAEVFEVIAAHTEQSIAEVARRGRPTSMPPSMPRGSTRQRFEQFLRKGRG